jgi:hypothetical protein
MPERFLGDDVAGDEDVVVGKGGGLVKIDALAEADAFFPPFALYED